MTFTPPVSPLQRDGDSIVILDQTRLPYACDSIRLNTLEEAADAIRNMQVRGAPLIGITAAFGIALALRQDSSDARLHTALDTLGATRPTAINLHWALERMCTRLAPLAETHRYLAAWREAEAIQSEDRVTCAQIGLHGIRLLEEIAQRHSGPVRIMTHCNAGWLATSGSGTALAPVYEAQACGLPVHVWVSETRPRNQGLLTAWELQQVGISYSVITDNAAGILIAQGEVDIIITGADRIAANGDTANKVGTYLKALAAADKPIPFYVAAPLSTIDFACPCGESIPIEERNGDEVRSVRGRPDSGHSSNTVAAHLLPDDAAVANPAFDITPARLISGILTERGLCATGQLHTLPLPHETSLPTSR